MRIRFCYTAYVAYWPKADIKPAVPMSASDPKRTSEKSVLLSPRFDYSGLMLAADHLGPFLSLVGDELAEIGGRAGKHRSA